MPASQTLGAGTAPAATAVPVAVTGLGATTPLGGTIGQTWDALLRGERAVRALDNDWTERYELPVNFAASLAQDPSEVLETRLMRRADPCAQYALVAAREAWRDAWGEADGAQIAPERVAVVIGTGIGGVRTMLGSWDTVRDKGARRLMPLTVPMLMPNSPAAWVAIDLVGKAGAHAPTSACASGAEAIVQGVRMIRTGLADVVIAGGTEAAIHPLTLSAFAKMQALSTRSDDPAGASRPFCATRDGFVMGEGAGVMILESVTHAQARGARIYAHVAGVGSTADAYDVAPPDPSGAGQLRAILQALGEAGDELTGRLTHVNAHATATPAGDVIEAQAIWQALAQTIGEDAGGNVLVSGTKSMTGHLLGAAGAVESIFTVLALANRVAPPTMNMERLDPEVPVTVVGSQPAALPASGDLLALNNAFGFGGHNMALAFATY
jgi:3-oxoacyl-[acyl-carrier-protein] synthase II